MHDGLAFAAPGPGSWEMDSDHFERPIFGMLEEVFVGASDGMRTGFQRYGALLDCIEFRVVNGFPYAQPRPLLGKPGDPPPPGWLMGPALKVMSWLHPGV